MSLPLHSPNAAVRQHQLKHEKLILKFTITGNATPASKTSVCDLPGIAILRTEGIVATADALEAVTWTTAADATNAVFGIIIDGSELGSIKRVLGARLTQVVATGTAIIVRAPNSGIHTAMLTSGGNVAVEFEMTGTTLASENPSCMLEIDFELN